MVFFMICDVILVAIYGYANLFRRARWRCRCCSAFPISPAWASASHFFHGSSERLYRRIAYVIIALAALVSLPLFDSDFALRQH